MDEINFDTRSDEEIANEVPQEVSVNFAKYEFNSYEQYLTKREALEPCDHNFVHIPTNTDICHIDVLWYNLEGHPYGWGTYAIDFDEGQGMNAFMGLDYQELKF